MKLFILSLFSVVAAADRLDNVYLPPSNAKYAGGNGNVLNAPFDVGNGALLPGQYGKVNGDSFSQYRASQEIYKAQVTSYEVPLGSINKVYSNIAQSPEARASILRFNNDNNGNGFYKYEYETENKIHQQEAGELKNIGTQQEGLVVEGVYSYVGSDGKTYTVKYIADENGFRASGDHIPTPPPVPEAIKNSLARIASHTYSQVINNGQNGNSQNGHSSPKQNRPNQPNFSQQSGYKY